MPEKLIRNPDVVWREEPEGHKRALAEEDREDVPCLTLVYLGTMYQLNYVASEIWKLCDGSRGADGIVEELLGKLDVSRERLEEDVDSFLDQMLSRGWLVRS